MEDHRVFADDADGLCVIHGNEYDIYVTAVVCTVATLTRLTRVVLYYIVVYHIRYCTVPPKKK